jgi:hypothetical protein
VHRGDLRRSQTKQRGNEGINRREESVRAGRMNRRMEGARRHAPMRIAVAETGPDRRAPPPIAAADVWGGGENPPGQWQRPSALAETAQPYTLPGFVFRSCRLEPGARDAHHRPARAQRCAEPPMRAPGTRTRRGWSAYAGGTPVCLPMVAGKLPARYLIRYRKGTLFLQRTGYRTEKFLVAVAAIELLPVAEVNWWSYRSS